MKPRLLIVQIQEAQFTLIVVCVSGAFASRAKSVQYDVHLMLHSAVSLATAHMHVFPPEMEYEGVQILK